MLAFNKIKIRKLKAFRDPLLVVAAIVIVGVGLYEYENYTAARPYLREPIGVPKQVFLRRHPHHLHNLSRREITDLKLPDGRRMPSREVTGSVLVYTGGWDAFIYCYFSESGKLEKVVYVGD